MRLFNKLVIFSLSVVVVLSGINVYAAPEDVWYSDVMETANKIGIINADEQPEETISNADFIKLAVNFPLLQPYTPTVVLSLWHCCQMK